MKSTSELFGMNSVSAPEVEPTDDMRKVAELAKKIAKKILGININVRFVKHRQMVTAQYDSSNKTVTFNTAKLGSKFFAEPVSAPVLNLLIHEIAHHGGSHTESGYHETLTKLGAELTIIALRDRSFFGLSLNFLVEINKKSFRPCKLFQFTSYRTRFPIMNNHKDFFCPRQIRKTNRPRTHTIRKSKCSEPSLNNRRCKHRRDR